MKQKIFSPTVSRVYQQKPPTLTPFHLLFKKAKNTKESSLIFGIDKKCHWVAYFISPSPSISPWLDSASSTWSPRNAYYRCNCKGCVINRETYLHTRKILFKKAFHPWKHANFYALFAFQVKRKCGNLPQGALEKNSCVLN